VPEDRASKPGGSAAPPLSSTRHFTDPDALAAIIAERLENDVRLALPLGIGKSAAVANALYRRARNDPTLELHIFTALTLEIPQPSSTLEARLLDPVIERLYADVPTFDYARDLRNGCLPDNVEVSEFYFRPGAWMGIAAAQQNYASINYTQAARDLAARGINVIAQLMAPEPGVISPAQYSLSCNPDVTMELIELTVAGGRRRPLLVAEICPALPFLRGDAIIDAAAIDLLLSPARPAALFPIPNRPVSLAEHAIALRAATLVEDGGTLQIGIGGLSDAIAHALVIRHRANDTFRRLVRALDADAAEAGLTTFRHGLYGASELLVEGFLHLRRHGILTRKVDGGVYLHAGFFVGSAAFYEALRNLDPDEAKGLLMMRITFVNQLLGDEPTRRRQRQRARFLNAAMKVTLGGAVVSDGLENGQVVSGVGGQYDFVAMAHQLADARSIIMLPATRTAAGKTESNIVWRYGHETIPRHLRDIVVTEYGVADLRGCTDAEVAARLLNIADSRFQDRLRKEAVAAGKLPGRHRIPECHAANLPGAIHDRIARAGLFAELPFYPLGVDLSTEEAALGVALERLGRSAGDWLELARLAVLGWRGREDPRLAGPLTRLGLAGPGLSLGERVLAALASGALLAEVFGSGRPLYRDESAQ